MTQIRGRQLTLHDGRRIGVAEFGRPGGRPVLYCHGFPASRLDGVLADEAAAQVNVRLIAPDRPGYGLSDFQPARRIGDWPRDALELADKLSVDRFAVLGISGGGPYAVACAAALTGRVTAVGIACGLGRLDFDEDVAPLNLFARTSFALARKAPGLSQLLNRILAPVLRNSPGWVVKLLAHQLSPPDRQTLSDPRVFAMYADSFREAFRNGGRGAALDLTLYAQPWDSAVESIRAPFYLWHGEQDTTVPIAMARRLSQAAGCRAEFLPDEGHFSLPIRRMADILHVLAQHA